MDTTQPSSSHLGTTFRGSITPPKSSEVINRALNTLKSRDVINRALNTPKKTLADSDC